MNRIYAGLIGNDLTKRVNEVLRMPSVTANFKWAGGVLLESALSGQFTFADRIVQVHGPQFANFFIAPKEFPAGADAIAATGVDVMEIRLVHMLAAAKNINESNAGLYRSLIRYSLKDVPFVATGEEDGCVLSKRNAVIEASQIALYRSPVPGGRPTNLAFLREIAKLETQAMNPGTEKPEHPVWATIIHRAYKFRKPKL
jgi:hypothetical protein